MSEDYTADLKSTFGEENVTEMGGGETLITASPATGFDSLDKDRQDETIRDYLSETDNKVALVELQADIDARRQGFGEVWRTGFSLLDAKLDGGFLGEQLIFLGAISSLGKTSFALQIATQIAEQGKDVLIFSLEMSKNELNAKTISRYSHIQNAEGIYRDYRLTTRDILSGNIGGVAMGAATDSRGKVYLEAYEAAKRIADNTRIVVGESDITVDSVRECVDIHIRATKRRPFVILDYLQILQPSEEARTTDKRLLTDYDVTRLKVLSRDFHIPVLVISAFNRMSYYDPVSMSSFRESSGIEYSSDVLLGMQYKDMDYKKSLIPVKDDAGDGNTKTKLVYESQADHNNRVRGLLDDMDERGAQGGELPIELKILKNRNGSKGKLFYTFLPKYNYYAEQDLPPTKIQVKKQKSGSSVVSKSSTSKKPV